MAGPPRARRRDRTGRGGRDTTQLLSDFGMDVPLRAEPPAKAGREQLFTELIGLRGRRLPGWGWSPARMPLAQYRMTSEQAPVLWPLIAAPGLPPYGARMGHDLLGGGAFYLEPVEWVLDDEIPVTNPNIFVFGKPGLGKSGTVKVFCLRMMEFGYRVLILGDVKDEYEPICRYLGVEPIAIGHGLPARINPLDLGPLGHGWERLDGAEAQRRSTILFARWLVLIRGLVGSQKVNELNVPFTPTDQAAVSAALRQLTGYGRGSTHLTSVTIPQLWSALASPAPELVAECRYSSAQHLLDDTRLMRDSLGQLVNGHLAGLFDEPTNITIDWDAPIQSLSLRRLKPLGDEAVGIALTCLNSWGQGTRELAAPGDRRIVVRDEAWMQMRLGVEPVKSLDANLRMSRSDGDIQVVCYHKPSDVLSVGADGSQAVNIAKELLHLADIKVMHGQDPAVAEDLGRLLGLRPMAQDLITGWAMGGKGRALWTVGDREYKVQVVRTPIEERLTWTNDQFVDAPS